MMGKPQRGPGQGPGASGSCLSWQVPPNGLFDVVVPLLTPRQFIVVQLVCKGWSSAARSCLKDATPKRPDVDLAKLVSLYPNLTQLNLSHVEGLTTRMLSPLRNLAALKELSLSNILLQRQQTTAAAAEVEGHGCLADTHPPGTSAGQQDLDRAREQPCDKPQVVSRSRAAGGEATGGSSVTATQAIAPGGCTADCSAPTGATGQTAAAAVMAPHAGGPGEHAGQTAEPGQGGTNQPAAADSCAAAVPLQAAKMFGGLAEVLCRLSKLQADLCPALTADAIASLPNLTDLTLDTLVAPQQLTSLHRLRSLYIRKLAEPDQLHELSSLHTLHILSDSSCASDFIPVCARLPELQSLTFRTSSTKVDKLRPELSCWQALSRLVSLDLRAPAECLKPGLPSLAELQALTSLCLDLYCASEEELVATVVAPPNLQHLYVSSDRIRSSGVINVHPNVRLRSARLRLYWTALHLVLPPEAAAAGAPCASPSRRAGGARGSAAALSQGSSGATGDDERGCAAGPTGKRAVGQAAGQEHGARRVWVELAGLGRAAGQQAAQEADGGGHGGEAAAGSPSRRGEGLAASPGGRCARNQQQQQQQPVVPGRKPQVDSDACDRGGRGLRRGRRASRGGGGAGPGDPGCMMSGDTESESDGRNGGGAAGTDGGPAATGEEVQGPCSKARRRQAERSTGGTAGPPAAAAAGGSGGGRSSGHVGAWGAAHAPPAPSISTGEVGDALGAGGGGGGARNRPSGASPRAEGSSGGGAATAAAAAASRGVGSPPGAAAAAGGADEAAAPPFPGAMQLSSLVLDACFALTYGEVVPLLRQLPELSELALDNCLGLEDGELALLAELRALREVTLSGCHLVSDAGLRALSRLPRLACLRVKGLRKLSVHAAQAYMRQRPITRRHEDIACSFLTSLSGLSGLRCLALKHLHSASEGALVTGLQRLTQLTRLEVKDVPAMSDAALGALAGHTRLGELAVLHCEGVSSRGRNAVVRSLGQRLALDFEGCSGVPDITRPCQLPTTSTQAQLIDDDRVSSSNQPRRSCQHSNQQ